MAQEPRPVKHVVILGLDGLAIRPLMKAIRSGRVPHIKELISQGSYTFSARSVWPTVSQPNWFSILSGTTPEFHGVDSNEWHWDRPRVLNVEGKCSFQPNIFSIYRQINPGANLGAFYQWDVFDRIIQPGDHLNISRHFQTDREAVDAALEFLDTRPPITFLYFGEIDEIGHSNGYGQAYMNAIQQTDQLIGRLMSQLDKLGMSVMRDTALILVTDHGRKEPFGKYHGSFTDSELNTMWLAVGPGIKSNTLLQSPVANWDTATTALSLLGVEPPVQMRGRMIKELFNGTFISLGQYPDFDSNITIGWRYVEKGGMPLRAECLRNFRLINPPIWGQWDNASFLIGLSVGFLLETLAIFIVLRVFKRPARVISSTWK